MDITPAVKKLLSIKYRLLLLASGVYLLVIVMIAAEEANSYSDFDWYDFLSILVYGGVLPLGFVWGTVWILRGLNISFDTKVLEQVAKRTGGRKTQIISATRRPPDEAPQLRVTVENGSTLKAGGTPNSNLSTTGETHGTEPAPPLGVGIQSASPTPRRKHTSEEVAAWAGAQSAISTPAVYGLSVSKWVLGLVVLALLSDIIMLAGLPSYAMPKGWPVSFTLGTAWSVACLYGIPRVLRGAIPRAAHPLLAAVIMVFLYFMLFVGFAFAEGASAEPVRHGTNVTTLLMLFAGYKVLRFDPAKAKKSTLTQPPPNRMTDSGWAEDHVDKY